VHFATDESPICQLTISSSSSRNTDSPNYGYLAPVTDHVDADARRSQPAYRAAVWLFRLAFVVAVAYVVAMATRAVPLLNGPSLALFLLLYLVCVVAGYALFARAGMRIFALAGVPADGRFGNSDEVKANRKIAWRDVFGRAR
jgi:hypothetical protein